MTPSTTSSPTSKHTPNNPATSPPKGLQGSDCTNNAHTTTKRLERHTDTMFDTILALITLIIHHDYTPALINLGWQEDHPMVDLILTATGH